jgi:hypothetical protein
MALATQASNSEPDTPRSLKMKLGDAVTRQRYTLYAAVIRSLRHMPVTRKTRNSIANRPPVFCVFIHRFLPHPYRFIARTNISRPTAINLTAFDWKGQSSFDCLPPVLLNNALTLLIQCSYTKPLTLTPKTAHLTHIIQSCIAATGNMSHRHYIIQGIVCFVYRAFRNIRVARPTWWTIILIYWVIIPLRVSGLLVAHHQEVTMCVCVCVCEREKIGTCCTP